MQKFKNLFISILYILLFLIVNFVVLIIFTLGFNLFSKLELGTQEYVESLALFLNQSKLFAALLSGLILFPVIIKNIRKRNLIIDYKWQLKNLCLIMIGVSSGIVLNIILFDIGLQDKTTILVAPFLSIISTTIVGPIIEELFFRGIIYHKLKESFRLFPAILLLSLLFGLFHLNLIQGIYAFLLSIIITYYYEKNDNLLFPILIHCFANISVALLLPFIYQLNFIYIQFILALFVFIGLISALKLRKS